MSPPLADSPDKTCPKSPTGVHTTTWEAGGQCGYCLAGTPLLGPLDGEELKDGLESGEPDGPSPAPSLELTADEIQCLTCAMAGNFPERFEPLRMGLLRKLARASRTATAA